MDDFDFRRATSAVWGIVDEANRYINRVRPWDLAKAEDRPPGDEPRSAGLDAALAGLVTACRTVACLLEPFLPDAAARVARQCEGERFPRPSPVFQRFD